MSDAVQELPNSPKWAAYRESSVAAAPPSRPWPTQQLDRAIIKLWPLLKHHRWSGPELLCVLRKVLDPADLVRCEDEPALIAYCSGTLGLRDVSLNSDRCRSELPA